MQPEGRVNRASRLKVLRPSLTGWLLLFGGLFPVTFWHHRKKFWSRMPRHAFKDHSVVDLIPEPILPSVRILHCRHILSIENLRINTHCASDLINHILNRISIPENATLVDMPTNEQHFRDDQRKPIFSLFRVYRCQLCVRKRPYRYGFDFNFGIGSKLCKICANQFSSIVVQGH